VQQPEDMLSLQRLYIRVEFQISTLALCGNGGQKATKNVMWWRVTAEYKLRFRRGGQGVPFKMWRGHHFDYHGEV
jgi:hypothetical protein